MRRRPAAPSRPRKFPRRLTERLKRTRSPPDVTTYPNPVVPTKVGGCTSALPKLIKVWGFWSLKNPSPTPGSSVTVPLPPLKTARSGNAAAALVLHGDSDRAVAAGFEARAGDPHPIAVRVVGAEQHGDVIAALVGDQHVGNAVSVHIGHGDGYRVGADEVGFRRRRKGRHTVRDGQCAIDHHGVRPAAHDDRIGQGLRLCRGTPTATSPGASASADDEETSAERLHRRVLRAVARWRLDRDPVVLLIADQHPGLTRPEQIGHDRKRHAISLDLERPVSLAFQDQHITVAVADQQVEEARPVAWNHG